MFKELLKVLGESLRNEEYTSRKGLLQLVDPRFKLGCFFSLIVVTVLLQSVLQFLLMLLFLIALAVASRVPQRAFFGRTAMVLVFSLVIVLPLPFITPGTPWLAFPLGPWLVSLSYEGLYSAALFTMRVWVSVGALTLLTLTTRFTALLHGMERLHFPRLFIQLTSLTYRYIFLFTNEAYMMGLAKEARTVRKERVIRLRTLRTISSMIGTLFIRAFERGEKVYQAMLARGYTGETRLLTQLQSGAKDWGFAVGLLLSALLIYFAPIIIPVTLIGEWF